MQIQELHVYLSALAYEAIVGEDEATANPFRLLPEKDRDKFGRIASAVQEGATVADGIAQMPTIDPVTGDRNSFTERSEYDQPDVAERAGLLPLSDAKPAESGELKPAEPKVVANLRKTK